MHTRCGSRKMLRPGPSRAIAYVNYFLEFGRKNAGAPAEESPPGGEQPCDLKKCLGLMACGAKQKLKKHKCGGGCPRPKRKSSCRPKRKKRSCAPRRKRRSCPKKRKRNTCGKKRKRCIRPGPLMNNGYLNFLRAYRKRNCKLTGKQAILCGAKIWCALPQKEKDRFNRMACKMAKSCRMKNSRICKQAAAGRRRKRRRC